MFVSEGPRAESHHPKCMKPLLARNVKTVRHLLCGFTTNTTERLLNPNRVQKTTNIAGRAANTYPRIFSSSKSYLHLLNLSTSKYSPLFALGLRLSSISRDLSDSKATSARRCRSESLDSKKGHIINNSIYA